MKEATSTEPSISELEPAEAVSYRAVSRFAVAALLLGAASSLALAHPILWLVPPTAAIVAFFALRSIAARPSELVGRGAALAGLGLALLFGLLAPARLISRQERIYSEARRHADDWLETIRSGNLYEAYELHLPANERQAGEVDLKAVYGDLAQLNEPAPMAPSLDMLRPDPKTSIRTFFSAEPAKTLVATGKAGELVFLGNESQNYRFEMSADDVTLRYELRSSDRGDFHKTTFLITLSRTYDAAARRATWHVASVREPS
jgi:hypothetical protein